MKLPSLWSGRQDLSDPFRSFRREMEDMFRTFDRGLPSLSVGAGLPAINVAETKDAFEVTVEIPGVEEKDINVSLDGNQLVISGEKKEETKKDEKDWHVEERSYGSFYRSMSLPFKFSETHLMQYQKSPENLLWNFLDILLFYLIVLNNCSSSTGGGRLPSMWKPKEEALWA